MSEIVYMIKNCRNFNLYFLGLYFDNYFPNAKCDVLEELSNVFKFIPF